MTCWLLSCKSLQAPHELCARLSLFNFSFCCNSTGTWLSPHYQVSWKLGDLYIITILGELHIGCVSKLGAKTKCQTWHNVNGLAPGKKKGTGARLGNFTFSTWNARDSRRKAPPIPPLGVVHLCVWFFSNEQCSVVGGWVGSGQVAGLLANQKK